MFRSISAIELHSLFSPQKNGKRVGSVIVSREPLNRILSPPRFNENQQLKRIKSLPSLSVTKRPLQLDEAPHFPENKRNNAFSLAKNIPLKEGKYLDKGADGLVWALDNARNVFCHALNFTLKDAEKEQNRVIKEQEELKNTPLTDAEEPEWLDKTPWEFKEQNKELSKKEKENMLELLQQKAVLLKQNTEAQDIALYLKKFSGGESPQIVMKTFLASADNAMDLRLRLFKEAEIHKKLTGHENIVTYIAFLYEPWGIVMERMDSNLFDYLDKSKRKFTLDETVDLLCQIINGLCHIHEKGIGYFDLKLNNLLIKTTNGRRIVKFSDFGRNKTFNPKVNQEDCQFFVDKIIKEVLPFCKKSAKDALRERLKHYRATLASDSSDLSHFLEDIKQDLESLVNQQKEKISFLRWVGQALSHFLHCLIYSICSLFWIVFIRAYA